MDKNMSLETAIKKLKENHISSLVCETKADVRATVESLLKEGSEVMQMTSVTLDETGVSELINDSGKYQSVRAMLRAEESPDFSSKQKTRLGSVPDYAVGSVHAVTEDGQLVIASNTGSQLPAYAYGPGKVIFVVGIQKIVKDLDAAMKRIYEYVLPLESERAKKAYGVAGSYVSKLLIINRELVPDRVTVVFVKEEVGF